jgi:hypothetical protein
MHEFLDTLYGQCVRVQHLLHCMLQLKATEIVQKIIKYRLNVRTGFTNDREVRIRKLNTRARYIQNPQFGTRVSYQFRSTKIEG